MKVYISVDIEGTTGITHWDEANKEKDDYKIFQEQMTNEAKAACEGALEAGATEILLKDAHWTGRNIITSKLPEKVDVIRGWSGHPFCMAQELDDSFDAVAFVGYHSRAGANTNPLAHSMTTDLDYVKVNGRFASEFLLHTHLAALVGVPVVFVSGDEGLCKDVKQINEHIETVAVSRGIGDSTISIHPHLALKKIKEGMTKALHGDLTQCRMPLPDQFDVEIRYRDHRKAYRASYYPQVLSVDAQTIRYETTQYFDVLRLLLFVAF